MKPHPCGMPWSPYLPAGRAREAAGSKPASLVSCTMCNASSGWHARVVLVAGALATSAMASPGAIASNACEVNGSCCTLSPQ